MKLVSVVLLNWNGMRFLKECLGSLEKQSYRKIELIVVDNASTDDSVNFIRKNFPKAKLVQNEKNLWIPGLNSGIKAAKGDYIITIGNDTRFEKKFVEELVKAAEKDSSIGLVAPKIVYFDGAVDSYGLRLYKSGLTADIKNPSERPFCPCGCAELFRKEALESINQNGEYFDKDFLAYADDLDIGMRIILKGWKCASAQSAVVHHIHSGSARSMSDLSIFLGDRNRINSLVKNFPTSLIIKNLHRIIFLQLLTIAKYSSKGKFLLIMKSKFSALSMLGKMLKKRSRIQNNKKLPSKQLEQLMVSKTF